MSAISLFNDILQDQQREIEIVRHELVASEARYANVIKLMSDCIGLLPPPDIVRSDGHVFRFNAPDPQNTLRHLCDAINRMRDELQVPPAPGYSALELRKGIEQALAMRPINYLLRNHLKRVLAGTCASM